MDGYELIRPFKSRKNQVWLIKDRVNGHLQVLKSFSQPECCARETELLVHLQQNSIKVPHVLAADDLSIRMTFINAPTSCDYFEQAERSGRSVPDEVIVAIWDHTARIYATPLFQDNQLALNDVNLRNILIEAQQNTPQIWQLDLEAVGPGSATADVAGMLAFFLTYDPVLTSWKLETCRRMRQLARASINFSPAELDGEIRLWLQRLGKRRGQDYLHNLHFD